MSTHTPAGREPRRGRTLAAGREPRPRQTLLTGRKPRTSRRPPAGRLPQDPTLLKFPLQLHTWTSRLHPPSFVNVLRLIFLRRLVLAGRRAADPPRAKEDGTR